MANFSQSPEFGKQYESSLAQYTAHTMRMLLPRVFQLLKGERIKRKIYSSTTEAKSDIFKYIEMFYNFKRRYSFNDQRSPLNYGRSHQKLVIGVYNFGGYSNNAVKFNE